MNRLLTIVDSKYQRLEYLESTGTQYIDTGIKGNQDTEVILEMFYSPNLVLQMYFGEYNYSGQRSNCFGIGHLTTYTKDMINCVFGTQLYTDSAFDYTSKFIVKMNKNGVYVNDSLVNSFSAETSFETIHTLPLFSGYNNSSLVNSSIKVDSCQIKQNGALVRNFVPVLRKTDNELGMLDLVEGKFYPNAGTGKFTANLDTMYAIIQGSPTQSPYGVFSGFSASNYLEVQQNLDSDNLEMVIDFTTGNSFNDYETILLNRSIFDLEYHTPYGLTSYSWETNTYNTVIPLAEFITNTHYKVKIKRSGNTISFAYSKNGGAFIDTTSFTTTKLATNLPCFGNSSVNTSRYFNGSIDLNNSYIKLGSTKYNLQAVVGYTVVGSPTITDGVVSGFGASDYLEISEMFKPSLNTWQFKIKFTPQNVTQYHTFVNSYYLRLAQGGGTNIIAITLYSAGSSYGANVGSLSNNVPTTILLDCIDGKTVNIYVNNIFSTVITLPSGLQNGANKIKIGSDGNNYFTGSIDLNETYIKINNKLWFNGQQA